jgi:hypothetical protein
VSYVIVIELYKMRLFIYIPIWMDQIWTFNLLYIYADWSFLWHLTTCFPFMVYLILYTYDMTPLRDSPMTLQHPSRQGSPAPSPARSHHRSPARSPRRCPPTSPPPSPLPSPLPPSSAQTVGSPAPLTATNTNQPHKRGPIARQLAAGWVPPCSAPETKQR